jgi:spore germination cell wall hydrolase CwlJ-like protein
MTLGLPSINANRARLIALTLASALLLAAGDASTTTTDMTPKLSDDSILAPMTTVESAAAAAALAASFPAGESAAAPRETPAEETPAARNLSQLVSGIAPAAAPDDADRRCLATAVYFEARGEPLEGQLAVAQAIINRTESGRYARSVCGVINQPGQFSFDRRRSPTSGAAWRTAQIIARIAADDMWRDVAPRADSFHAARLSPAWRDKVRVAQIGNHVFYR